MQRERVGQRASLAIGEEEGVAYQIDRNFQGKFGPVHKGGSMLNFLKFEPVELVSEICHMTKKQCPSMLSLLQSGSSRCSSRMPKTFLRKST